MVFKRPLVLVHGLWDTPKVFDRFLAKLDQYDLLIFKPYLPHALGRTSIQDLSKELNRQILVRFGSKLFIDVLGFSMGGLVLRYWLQNLDGAKRTKRFISIGSPHKGTFTAQIVPSWLMSGIADMKRGSVFLKELNSDFSILSTIDCVSFYCLSDLMVFPGWEAVLPIGKAYSIPVLTHKQLIIDRKALDLLTKEVSNGL